MSALFSLMVLFRHSVPCHLPLVRTNTSSRTSVHGGGDSSPVTRGFPAVVTVDGVLAVVEPEETEEQYTGIAGSNPVPLSPDALTAFSNGDPDAKQRNS